MEYTPIQWRGFDGVEFVFANSAAKVIRPHGTPNGKWALKTEYFDAFPAVELELLRRGWHIAYQKNDDRWAQEKDIARKADFIRFVSKEFSLNEKCSMVGMSCGGMYAVLVTARCPELVDVLYLDAPVINLLSCPCDMGVAQSGLYEEFYRYTGKTRSEMLSYRNHPLDHIPTLIAHKIPVVLVAGDSDKTVPYVENGELLAHAYEKADLPIRVFVKAGCDHHPHGMDDPTVIADAIEAFSNERKDS
jgi:alpha-beta hydrolase superfamily lysophospholipase